MIWPFSTPTRSRRTQAQFARFKNETKSRRALSQAAGLQAARGALPARRQKFSFSATFSWVLVRALSQPMGKVCLLYTSDAADE